ncbi:hypothetical protein [Atopobium fossor]|uniref:hypothetical protein n=1 Tax=Atopobium fossor TaxID=39487 RepID=UPI000481DBF2|nr:hypothetical protein [Atopobium fossor]
MKYLFCLLTPAGMVVLVASIKYIIRFAKTKKIYEMPYTKGQGVFTLAEKGRYGLWFSGKLFTRTPIGKFSLNLINQQTGQSIPLSTSILRTTIKRFSAARMELYSFTAEAGTYVVSVVNKKNSQGRPDKLITAIPSDQIADYSLFSIQVRSYISVLVLFVCVLGCILGCFGILFGIVLPIVL